METDARYNSFDFANAATGVPAGFIPIVDKILSDVLAMPIRRRVKEAELMMDGILHAYSEKLGTVLEYPDHVIDAGFAAIYDVSSPASPGTPAARSGSQREPSTDTDVNDVSSPEPPAAVETPARTHSQRGASQDMATATALSSAFQPDWEECAGVRFAMMPETPDEDVKYIDLGLGGGRARRHRR